MGNSYRLSIETDFKETIWQPFLKAIEKYRLIQNGDNIAVCISGGKDSMLLALLFKMLKEQGLYDIGVTYLCMDPGYASKNREMIEHNALKQRYLQKRFYHRKKPLLPLCAHEKGTPL